MHPFGVKKDRKKQINFDDGELTSDAGLLVYREFDQKLGLSQCFEEHFYMEDDCADSLRYEPLFTEILGKDFLTSQPTLSRLNTSLTDATAEQLEILAFYCNRGTMENFIKEGKNGFEFDRMSSTNFVANKNKLQISMLAYTRPIDVLAGYKVSIYFCE